MTRTATKTDRQTFALVLRDNGGASPVANRLRFALKYLGRVFGLRCIYAVPVPNDWRPTIDPLPEVTQ